MTMMAQQPNDDEIQQFMQMAAPKNDPTGLGLPPALAATPVDPHDTLTVPISAAPPDIPTMAAAPASAKPVGTPKMSPLAAQEEHINKNLMADYQKDADPYGSPDNHPGFLGRLLHGLNVATGGVNRRGYEEQGLEKRVQDIGKQESEQGLQGSETAKNTEDANEMPQRAADKHALVAPTVGHINAETEGLKHPADKDPYMATYRSLTTMGMSPTEALQEIEKDKALALKSPGLHYETTVDPKTGKPETYGLDEQGNKKVDVGQHYERPQVTNINAGEKNLWSVPQPDGTRKAVSIKAGDVIPKGAVSMSGQNSETVSGDKKDQAAADSARNMDDELGLMKQFAATPSPTNDAAMLMHYIGATKPESMGKIRLNENEIKLFGGTRSSLGDAEALLTKVANGQMLTPKQRQDMISTMTAITNATHRGSAPTGGSAPQRPANVPEGYQFNQNGPKGAGWYKPTPK